MRLVSWNVNGLRAIYKKGFGEWLETHRPEVLALQEIKCSPDQLTPEQLNPLGYRSWFFPAAKAGYSGVAVYALSEPSQVWYGLGQEEFDCEGRSLTLEFPDFYLLGAYFPNAQGEGRRLDYKLRFLQLVEVYVSRLQSRGKPVLICGDLNVAHQEIDIHDPVGNRKQAGFLPEERAWMTQFLGQGYQDLFRQQNPEPHHYTWWSYISQARQRNKGWRIDYFVASPDFDLPYRCRHYPEVLGSDHCPVELELL